MEPLVIGVTGSIGTGKSTFGRELAGDRGKYLDADALAKQLMEPGQPGHEPVVDSFGEGILGPDGSVDHERLGARVFEDHEQLERLESILHPLLRVDLRRRIESGDAPFYVLDAALLLEAGWEDLCDVVLVVTAPEDRVNRRIRSRGLSDEQIEQRRRRQFSQAEKARRADRVVHNDGTEEQLLREARDLRDQILRQESTGKGPGTTRS